jgi:EAL domain-containing protein (putative c-di-GMP-specific phosphodiesterase class I)
LPGPSFRGLLPIVSCCISELRRLGYRGPTEGLLESTSIGTTQTETAVQERPARAVMKPSFQPGIAARKPGKRQLEALDKILTEGILELVFQPIFELATGEVFGYEVLTRSPSRVFKGPESLFSAAARAGRVGELGRLQRFLAVSSAPGTPLFINVHPGEFDHPFLVKPDDPIFRHGDDVYLEVTESAPLSYFEQCTSVLGELQRKGIRVAIDDFGAGFSNVKYIADLSPDVVKLDRELMSEVRHGSRQFRLLISIVRLCKDMGARVVAEGIETTQEYVVAEHAGVDFCQGYLVGRPSQKAEARGWSPST